MNRLERLYAVTEEIRRRAPNVVSAAVLADKFGVSRRTMERDLASLRVAGVPLYALSGRLGGQATLDEAAPTGGDRVVSLSVEEITGLLMAVTASSPMPYGDAASAGAQRLADALAPAAQVLVNDLRSRIRVSSDRPYLTSAVPAEPPQALGSHTSSVGSDRTSAPGHDLESRKSTQSAAVAAAIPSSDGTQELVGPSPVPNQKPLPTVVRRRIQRVLEKAVRHQRVLNLRYVSPNGIVTERTVEAVGFYRGSNGWFLIAWCRLRSDRRIFRLDRVLQATMTTETFERRSVNQTLGWVPDTVVEPG